MKKIYHLASAELIRAFRANELGEPGDADYQNAAADLIENLTAELIETQKLMRDGWIEVAESPVTRHLTKERDDLKREIGTLKFQFQNCERQAELLVRANEYLYDQREALRKELDEIKRQASDATEYVLASINQELKDRLDVARRMVEGRGGIWPW